ncbi:fibronectin type III domain-containing protein [Paenibacillus sp. KS-LC4]|uniref:fibronectin type III domain-containing protein n=1 Tax=Paenibacillus sp. KS-LC4 TaxID=2979727 RepID=UPI0030D32801
MRWKSGLAKWVLCLSLVVTFFSFQTNTYAATVGSTKLTQAEAGWQRFDDSDNHFVYSGTTTFVSGNNKYYNNTLTNLLADGSKVTFKFEGTKIRIIGSRNPDKSDSMKITIDGTDYTFKAKGAEQTQTLLYENTTLQNGIHDVTVTYVAANSSSNFVFDAVDIDATGKLVSLPKATTNLQAVPVSETQQIALTWSTVGESTYYNVFRSVTPGGPYSQIATNVDGTSYNDQNVVQGVTYYYVITAINNVGTSGYSNESSAALEETGRAILTIIMTNGLEKEYDLTIQEVNAFIAWYDAKASGTGPAKYAFNKSWNKGPFNSRTEYIIHDKILVFNVDQYS